MKNLKRLLAMLLAVVMVAALFAGCQPADKPVDTKPADTTAADTTPADTTAADTTPADTTPATTEPAQPKNDTLVVATSAFDQNFSTFFATTAYDMEIVDLTTGYLLAADREGQMVLKGIEGETRAYNGTDYTYYAMGDCEVTQNDDGSVDYDLTMRDDIKFSDGTPATIDDVIFGIYVLSDPTYDGSSTIYAIPIEGMEEYRSGMEARGDVIFKAGPDGYTENDLYTEDQYNEFWKYYNENAGADFAKEICDYCISNGYNAPDDSVAACAANWGFELEEDADYNAFWEAIVAAYDTVEEAEATESAGSDRLGLTKVALGADYMAGVSTGSGAANISGIIKTGDYSLRVHCTKFDATAIYNMSFPITPLHYYGDPAQYDYENNSFGFPKGDLRIIRDKTTEPLGCGPYVFKGYGNSVVSLEANPNYFQGEPKIKNLKYQESVDSDYVPGIVAGNFDIASPSLNETTVAAIKAENSNGELEGDVLTAKLIDYRGYGYLGINGNLVSVGGDGSSEQSKDLRLAIMTVLAICRDTVIASYYGDRASVIQYPISNTSWAAPRPTDEGYRNAYSTAVDGTPIYTDDMTEEEKYEAAAQAALAYLEAAGYTVENGKVTAAPEGAKGLSEKDAYEIMIPGQGQQDHPAYGIAVKAQEILRTIGFELSIQDVGTSVWSSALTANTAEMWAAAWQSTADPDMYQVYHSSNADGQGTNSNHYQIKDADLDEIIVDARSSADNTYRKSAYKEALEIILSWGVELPLYQRKDGTVFSTDRVKTDSLPADMTPYYGWSAEIQNLELN